ncbi:MAG: hypothetical protein LCH91_05660 [Bacteroidetes bacterium]|nr:hypothetical protein [Bacteroidota bacterium]
MLDRIDILKIIINHFKTLRKINDTKKGISIEDFMLFIVFPIVSASILTYYKIQIDSQVSNLIAVISIFGGFLINLLAIIYGFLDKIKAETKKEIKKKFAVEINSNISFNIILSLFIAIFLVIYNLIPSQTCSVSFLQIIKSVLLFLNYFMLILFVLTLLMVLNRIYILLQSESIDS